MEVLNINYFSGSSQQVWDRRTEKKTRKPSLMGQDRAGLPTPSVLITNARFLLLPPKAVPRVSNLLASLGNTGRRRAVLGHTLNTQTLMKTDEQKKRAHA